jgi:hypothetical protein
VQLAHRADNSAVLAVSNVKVTMEAQHSIPPVGLHGFLQESFTFTFTFSVRGKVFSLLIIYKYNNKIDCMNSSWADSRVSCLKTSDVSETHSVPILRESECL